MCIRDRGSINDRFRIFARGAANEDVLTMLMIYLLALSLIHIWNGTNHDPGVDLEYYVASQIQEAVEGVEEAPGVVRVKPQKHPRLRRICTITVFSQA